MNRSCLASLKPINPGLFFLVKNYHLNLTCITSKYTNYISRNLLLCKGGGEMKMRAWWWIFSIKAGSNDMQDMESIWFVRICVLWWTFCEVSKTKREDTSAVTWKASEDFLNLRTWPADSSLFFICFTFKFLIFRQARRDIIGAHFKYIYVFVWKVFPLSGDAVALYRSTTWEATWWGHT